MIIGAVAGAIAGAPAEGVGAIPGAGAGALEGFQLAGGVGDVLLGADIDVQTQSILKALYNIKAQHDTGEEREKDHDQIANSLVDLAINFALIILGAIASRFAKAIISRVRGLRTESPKVEPPKAKPPKAEPSPAGTRGTSDIDVPTRVGDTEHHLSVRNGSDGPEVWVCTGPCGPLKEKINGLLPYVRDPEVRAKLESLKVEADNLETRIRNGEISEAEGRAAVRVLADKLHAIGSADHRVGILLDHPPGAPEVEGQAHAPTAESTPRNRNDLPSEIKRLNDRELHTKIAQNRGTLEGKYAMYERYCRMGGRLSFDEWWADVAAGTGYAAT